MDDGKGSFVPITEEQFEEPPVEGKFRVGQAVECNGSRFRVHAIRRKQLVLKLLPKKETP